MAENPSVPFEVAFLRGGQQGVQHLDRRLEHLDEFQQALVGQAQAARVAVGVGVVLGVALQLADVDLAHQRGNVLVVLVARLGLGDGHLAQHGGVEPHDAELRDVAVEFAQALDRPGRHDAAQVAARDAVLLLQRIAEAIGMEQAQRRFVDGRTLQRIDGVGLHQHLQPLGDRGLAAAHRPQQIENLLALFQPCAACLKNATI